MKESEDFITRNRVVLNFIVLFFIFLAVFHFIFYDIFMYKDSSREFTAEIVGFLLNLSGISASVDGYTVTMSNFNLGVIYECVGIGSMIVYSSFVLAYPTGLKKKLAGIVLGIPGLYAIAVIRLSVLAVIGMTYPDMWNYFHVYFWQLSLIIFVILLLLLWFEKVVKPGENE